jgi:DsbC/DsbD-like thiol-disulfide interchange protein
MAMALAEYLDTDDPAIGNRTLPRTKLGIAPDSAIILAAGQDSDRPTPAKQADGKSAGKSAVVTGQAYLSVDRLPAGKTCKVLVQLQIAEGWHIHANPAGDPEIDLATEVELDSKLGIELTKIVYPAGKKVERGDDEKPQSLYMGKVNLIGQLDVPAKAAGRRDELTVTVAFQACNDAQCLPPKKLKLTLPVTVANADEPVKQINQALFAPPKKEEPGKKKK